MEFIVNDSSVLLGKNEFLKVVVRFSIAQFPWSKNMAILYQKGMCSAPSQAFNTEFKLTTTIVYKVKDKAARHMRRFLVIFGGLICENSAPIEYKDVKEKYPIQNKRIHVVIVKYRPK